MMNRVHFDWHNAFSPYDCAKTVCSRLINFLTSTINIKGIILDSFQ